MPLPLKLGYNFNYDRTKRAPYFEMSSAEAYTDFYGISLMLSGEGLIYTTDFTDIVYPGEMVFIPKNVYHRTVYISDSAPERILIKFTEKMVYELFEQIGEETYQKLCHEHIIRFSKESVDAITSIFKLMENEWNHYDAHSELILKGLLNMLIITCIRKRIIYSCSNFTTDTNIQNRFLFDAIIYIRTHLSEKPSMKETAAHLNISESYLSKLFAAKLHTPYSTFVLTEQISLARNLLTKTNLSMTDIALQAGFSSSSYFSDSFKRINGISPIQFRKQQLINNAAHD